MMAEVLSGRVSPSATLVAPRLCSVCSTASWMNWLICGLMLAGSMTLATVSTPPLTPMATPTLLSQRATRVLSYTIFGHAVRMMLSILMAQALLIKIWFGIRPVIMA